MKIIRTLTRKQKLYILLNVVLLVCAFAVALRAKKAVSNLYSQQEATRWETEEHTYAMVSAFFSAQKNYQEKDVNSVNNMIMETLLKDSLYAPEGNSRVWINAYSGECTIDVRKDNNTLTVTAVGVGNDFFQFHPSKLLSGSYISAEDLNDDRIVLDENLAWALFGSNDIVGMPVWIGNTQFVVAGVIKCDEDALSRIAYGDVNRMYINYGQLKRIEDSLVITSYETVLPNPIHNYALQTLKTACGVADQENDDLKKEKNPLCFDDIEFVENSNRYETLELITHRKLFAYRSMHTNGIQYPYWENVARVKEQEQYQYLCLIIILLFLPVVSVILLVYHLWTQKTWTIKGIAKQGFSEVFEYISLQREKRKAGQIEQEQELPKCKNEESDDAQVELIEDETFQLLRESLSDEKA